MTSNGLPPVHYPDIPEFTYSPSTGLLFDSFPREPAERLLRMLDDEVFLESQDLQFRDECLKFCTKRSLLAQHEHYGIATTKLDLQYDLQTKLLEAVRKGKCDKQPPELARIQDELERKYKKESDAYEVELKQQYRERFLRLADDPKKAISFDVDLFFDHYILGHAQQAPRALYLTGSKGNPESHPTTKKLLSEKRIFSRYHKWDDPSVATVIGSIDVLVIGTDRKAVNKLFNKLVRKKKDALDEEEQERIEKIGDLWLKDEMIRREGNWKKAMEKHKIFVKYMKPLYKEGGHDCFPDDENVIDGVFGAILGTYVLRCDFMASAQPAFVGDGFCMNIREDYPRMSNFKGGFSVGADFFLGMYKNCSAQFWREGESPYDYSVRKNGYDNDNYDYLKRSRQDIRREEIAHQRKVGVEADSKVKAGKRFYFIHRGRDFMDGTIERYDDTDKDVSYIEFTDSTFTEFKGVFYYIGEKYSQFNLE
ncbi:hypothetical protein BJ508DRAFT_364836 [Ascobolus immersus RN42]|uniref:Uncharacterized protein n=1 Tax=Ascobolus immersus RN42 TaxID=1160509 RepID=A0A3N4HSQ7_ASCIM|nr:hypothetical protein BJ508DRAFT_364836 [Ascobolus immersus RN42]